MTRKLHWLLSVLLGAVPGGALALGVGQIEVRSGLNQPLNARIPLLLTEEDKNYLVRLSAGLAPAQAFDQAGIERSSLLTELKFSVQTDPSGNSYVQVTSKRTVREPMLDFLVEVNWPKGRVVREFAILLDPPALAPRRTATPVAAAPPAKPGGGQPTASPPPVAHRGTATYGPISRGETLWSIADRLRPDPSVSRRQMMEALFRANPRAFWRPGLDGLMAGATLRIPSAQEVDSSRFSEETSRQLAQRQAPPAPPAPAPQRPSARPVATPDQVRLLPPEPEEERPAPAASPATTPPAAAKAVASPFRIPLEGDRPQLRVAGMADLRQRIDTLGRSETGGRVPPEQAEARAGAAVSEPLPEREPSESGAARPPIPVEAGVPAAPPRFQETLPAAVAPSETAPSVQETPAATATPERQRPAEAPSSKAGPPQPQPAPAVVAPPPQQTPKVTEPAARPPAPEEPGFLGGMVDTLLADPLKLALIGFISLLLIALLWFLMRRSRKAGEEDIPAFETVVPEQMAIEETAVIKPTERPLSDLVSKRSRAASTLPTPLERANSLITAGNYREAGDTIRSALAQNPDNTSLRAKLLDVYYATGNKEGFLKEAQLLHDKLRNETDPLWTHAAELGRELEPNHPLFRRTAEAGSGRAAAGLAPVIELSSKSSKAKPADTLDILDFDLERQVELSEAASTRTHSEFPDTATSELDWQLPSAEPSTVTSTLPPEPPAKREAIEFQLKDLNFDFDQVASPKVADKDSELSVGPIVPDNADFLISTPPAQAKQDSGLSLPDELDFKLDSRPMVERHESAASENSTPSTEDYVETKLDLAMAYLDMGDSMGARSLLEEVLQEGNADQRQRAQEFMAKLG